GLERQRHVLRGLHRMAEHQLQRRAAGEAAADREHLDRAVLLIHTHHCRVTAGGGRLVGAQVGDLGAAGGAAHLVQDRVVAAGAQGHHQQADAGDDGDGGQHEHQDQDRVAPDGGLFAHGMGPKKLLSTSWRTWPSADSTTNTMSWRPVTPAGAAMVNGSDSTCWASRETVPSASRWRPSSPLSTAILYSARSPPLLISFSV